MLPLNSCFELVLSDIWRLASSVSSSSSFLLATCGTSFGIRFRKHSELKWQILKGEADRQTAAERRRHDTNDIAIRSLFSFCFYLNLCSAFLSPLLLCDGSDDDAAS
jgi:hypothetical protein